jgi:DNA polymerase-3 subunit epsilon
MSTLRFEPDGSEQLRSQLINPRTPISPGATKFHGISDEDVAARPTFDAYAKALEQHLKDCDLAGFGIRHFHLKILKREFEFAGIDFNLDNRAVIDAMEIFHKLEPRDFDAAYRRYSGGTFTRPADSETIVNALRAIITGQLAQHPELPNDPSALESWATGEATETYLDDEGRFALSDDGDPIINFGRYRGYTLYDMSESYPDYLRWIANNESFTEEQRRIAADAADGIMPDY